MTNTEAARILSNGLVNAPSNHIWATAFKMAIKALEEQKSGVNGNIWTCPNCGGTFTFQSCPHCNAEMEVEHEND